MTTTPPVIELDRVSRTYPGGVQALQDTSLRIWPHELTAIVGPSGSGKSTMLQLMGTLDHPTKGTVRILGYDVAALNDRQLSAVRASWIGFVFQQFFLTAHFTAVQNVANGQGYSQSRFPWSGMLCLVEVQAEQGCESAGVVSEITIGCGDGRGSPEADEPDRGVT
jgi:ABC-type phosphate/phosphonate transport system ATPase subunit